MLGCMQWDEDNSNSPRVASRLAFVLLAPLSKNIDALHWLSIFFITSSFSASFLKARAFAAGTAFAFGA
ncbi:hypothetical protein BOTNAR_0321g00020 [Botryotinia narcissicola]|uniref:Uncharacterized protein n=1 Tax=Botryotinia narcissicola TaxID=278944 RepID=A0A4Z1HUA3_9HELO|nr:hypothetical protein BOTNAR_0321g00020 [Botryotinia narcissicola]